MLNALGLVLGATAIVVVVQFIADKVKLPAAALLVMCGLVVSATPVPEVLLDPEVVLTLVIPPLLYSAALKSSLIAIRKNLFTIFSLSVALVLATALLVGVGVDLLVPGVTLAAGVALGAAVAPPDPVAALAVGRKAGIPPRILTLIEGEGLLNDATALTVLTVAITAAASGDMSPGKAGGLFVLASVGGVLVGLAVALLIRLVRTLVDDALLLNAISLATPFVAYVVGEQIHASGVLAVVVAALAIGHDSRHAVSGASRLQTTAVWRLIDLLLEGYVFLLIGEQLPTVVGGLAPFSTTTIVVAVSITLGVVLLFRPLWLVLTEFVPRGVRVRVEGHAGESRRLNGREVIVMSWAGTRGVITVAAVFSIPMMTDSGEPFPSRDLLLFCAFVVVLVTVVGQGVTFAPLVRRLGLRANPADEARLRNDARRGSAKAALRELDRIAEEEKLDSELTESMREDLSNRIERYRRRLDHLDDADDDQPVISPEQASASSVRRRIIGTQRDELLRWRDEGRLPDASMRILERELDHEEHSLGPTTDS